MMQTKIVCEETGECFKDIKITILPCSKTEFERVHFNIRLDYAYVFQGNECWNIVECIYDRGEYWDNEDCVTLTAATKHTNKKAALYLANRLTEMNEIDGAIIKMYNHIRLVRLQNFVMANPEFMHLMKIEFIPETYNNKFDQSWNVFMQKC